MTEKPSEKTEVLLETLCDQVLDIVHTLSNLTVELNSNLSKEEVKAAPSKAARSKAARYYTDNEGVTREYSLTFPKGMRTEEINRIIRSTLFAIKDI